MIVITIIIKLIIFLPGRAGLGEECSSSLQCQLEQVDNVPFFILLNSGTKEHDVSDDYKITCNKYQQNKTMIMMATMQMFPT